VKTDKIRNLMLPLQTLALTRKSACHRHPYLFTAVTMPPSQLKRLKASLREEGIIGPQKSKKQRQKLARDRQNGQDKRLQRSAALDGIREQFNPFQFKINARGPKFETTSIRNSNAKAGNRLGRPGASKAAGEEKRRRTLLSEMHSRNKVGGIRDRRFGEEDPTMTAEEKALQRFAREQQAGHKKASIFDLEDEGPEEPLTHMGRALDLVNGDRALADDFDERDLPSDSDSAASREGRGKLKRTRTDWDGLDDQRQDADPDAPERKKTRQEVMQEVMAKSKHYKHERQAAKDADDELRMEIDGEMSALQALLAQEKVEKAAMKDGPPTLLAGYDKKEFEQAYDLRVRQLAQDKRAQPSERTKTAEEIAEEEAVRLKELEEKRSRRMAGEDVSDSDDAGADGQDQGDIAVDQDKEPAEADFGLGTGIDSQPRSGPLRDDEDEFVIDDDLVASGSDIDEDDDEEESNHDEQALDEDDEFTKGLLTTPEEQSGAFKSNDEEGEHSVEGDELPFTFPCPQTHEELVTVLAGIPLSRLPQVIQRVRALHHPSLAKENNKKLATFAKVLVEHIAYMANEMDIDADSSTALEGLMRHVHSLAKSFPIEVSLQFREQLESMGKTRPLALEVGDLATLTAIRLYPTSDHFHLVVTPAMLTMARYLGQNVPADLGDYATGAYLSIQALDYQRLSSRYIPELVNFTLNTLCALAPVSLPERSVFPMHKPAESLRISDAQDVAVRKLTFADCRKVMTADETVEASRKIALVDTTIAVLAAAADVWASKAAFTESFAPVLEVLQHLHSKQCRSHLPPALRERLQQAIAKVQRVLAAARLSRRPLELHHHRPMAIKTFVPKFEDGFAPSKHYDADRERAQLAKLRVEHKRERKGAIRELRKDAAFVARENLRVKKEKDAAYEKKYKRLVAEIQGEEGHEANLYEKEKGARKRARGRR
jgi:nucleolar protein 14